MIPKGPHVDPSVGSPFDIEALLIVGPGALPLFLAGKAGATQWLGRKLADKIRPQRHEI